MADVLTTEQRTAVVHERSPLADARPSGVRVADLAELPPGQQPPRGACR
ncbi:hypothetical protein HZZ00_25095 [Streptomyces sp. NEAU-sy36]|nr:MULTISPECIES: hypothetical protein [unclassified Streptomyces]QLJ03949.1 hypothetical protein HZZ00_25095 [Streptomyces sp. NEAU-sy36]